MSARSRAYGDEVAIAARPELRATRDALAGKACLLERALLGHVLDVGRRLDPVSVGVLEEPRREETLGLAAETLAAGLGDQVDPEVPRGGWRVGPVRHAVPADGSDRNAIRDPFDDQRAIALVAQRSLREDLAWGWFAGHPEVVEAALQSGVRRPRVEHVRVLERHVPKTDPGRRIGLARGHQVLPRGSRWTVTVSAGRLDAVTVSFDCTTGSALISW